MHKDIWKYSTIKISFSRRLCSYGYTKVILSTFRYIDVHSKWNPSRVMHHAIVASKVYVRGHGGLADTSMITFRDSLEYRNSKYQNSARLLGLQEGLIGVWVSSCLMLMISSPKVKPFYGFWRQQIIAISRFVEDCHGKNAWDTLMNFVDLMQYYISKYPS